jgi:Vacuolar protein sorting-associated protein 35
LCQKVPQDKYNDKELNCMVDILTFPLEKMSICVLNLTNYPNLMNLLPFDRRKLVAVKIVEAVLNTKTFLVNESIVVRLISFIMPLIELQEDAVRIKAKELESEQTLIARMLHYIQSHDPNVTHRMLKLFEAKFSEGPVEWKKFTIPSLVTNYLRLAQRVIEFNKAVEEGENITELFSTRYDFRSFAPYLTEEENSSTNFEVTSISFEFSVLFEELFVIVEELSLDYPAPCIRLYLDLAQIIA